MVHRDLFHDASQIFPGGVNSPVRSFKSAGQPYPLFIRSAHKSFVIDEQNRCFLDFVGSWGPMIHGHSHPKIIESVTLTAKKGLSFGAPTKKETILARMIQKFFPKMEKMRFTSSGTEAAMTAIRIARAATQRNIIIKFQGCYHGHSDSLLVEIGSAGASASQALTSHGILPTVAQYTHVLPYNDVKSLIEYFESFGSEIAAVIFEPIAGNMGCIPATSEFIDAINECCRSYGALSIADEVMTGFRVNFSGACGLYPGFNPDLYLLGKIVGGGLPLGVVGGNKDYIDLLSPIGPVYHAGTLSGNPLAVQAGIASLELLMKEDFYPTLKEKTSMLCKKISSLLNEQDIAHSMHYRPGMFSLFDTPIAPMNFSDVQSQSAQKFHRFFSCLLNNGIYWPPSLYEACFISQAHTHEQLLEAAEKIAQACILADKYMMKLQMEMSAL
jgi:glutamate-1-semialdehyde 2,1-aminomutase